MKENKIPTAEEFINDSAFIRDIFTDEFSKSILAEKFIEFAKLHAKAALKAASEKAITDDVGSVNGDGEWMPYDIVNKESILNSYPLENIK